MHTEGLPCPRLTAIKNGYPNATLTRTPDGVLEVRFHTDGAKLVFNGHTHEQFTNMFH